MPIVWLTKPQPDWSATCPVRNLSICVEHSGTYSLYLGYGLVNSRIDGIIRKNDGTARSPSGIGRQASSVSSCWQRNGNDGTEDGTAWADVQAIQLDTGTFRAQDLSFPRTNSPYRELSCSRDSSFPGTFVPGERKFPGTFVPGHCRSRELSFPRNESSWELSFPGPFVLRNFRSQELSFLRLFYKALAMNADSCSDCQNLFRSRPSSVCFPK